MNKSIVYNYDTGGNIVSKVEYPYTTKATKYVAKSYSIGQLADTALSFVKKGVQEIGNMFLKALFGR